MEQQINAALQRGFIDQDYSAWQKHRPLVLNNKEHIMLPTLLEELRTCRTFMFSVAFITESGLMMLKSVLYDLHHKGVKGKILTSTYLQFNQPKVFSELLKLPNVAVRVTDEEGFHAKGYIFQRADYYSLIVGSSNLTAQALKKNYEWNVRLSSMENGELIQNFLTQFNTIWQNAKHITPEWIDQYKKAYQPNVLSKVVIEPHDRAYIMPNRMQQTALREIQQLRKSGEKRGLVISATGTGKTYLSAFAVREANPKRLLFVVHREQILQKAIADYRAIIGGYEDDFALLTGHDKNYDATYTFATIQTLAQDTVLQRFAQDHFDYIIIDEVHRAGATTYHKVLDYFKPDFLLGMTATPERTDQFNVFALFDYNVAYEIRLQEALQEDLLCPFHYFGVTDYEKNGETICEQTPIQQLTADERVHYILQKASYYGFSGEFIKGLIFCSSKQEAYILAEKMRKCNIEAYALTGEDSQEQRQEVIQQLVAGKIAYILTVDIFNEGIDIPEINQIIMLRQTTSSIVFIQQLGRGLRKHPQKDFVTIIDFIGNYKNNYLIPTALAGDQSLNKDNALRHTMETQYIEGVSTINFEEIAQQRIFDAIHTTNLHALRNIKEAYLQLKQRLNHIPSLTEFMQYHSIDPETIMIDHLHYVAFLQRINEIEVSLTKQEEAMLTFMSQELLNGKRIHEVQLLSLLIENKQVSKETLLAKLEGYDCSLATLQSVERVLMLLFYTKAERKKYGNQPYIEKQKEQYQLSDHTEKILENKQVLDAVKDILQVAILKNKQYEHDKPLTIGRKYTRKDVCRLLNWEQDETSTMYGYKTKVNTTPLFITYNKDESLESSVLYGDQLINDHRLLWYSRANRKRTSKELEPILQHTSTIHIFIKKQDKDKDYYYLGQGKLEDQSVCEEKAVDKQNKSVPIVKMEFNLTTVIKESVYHYLTHSIK